MGYFNLNKTISLILLIIPFTAWIFGVATRLSQGHWIGAILRIVFGCWLLWAIELVQSVFCNNCDVKLIDIGM